MSEARIVRALIQERSAAPAKEDAILAYIALDAAKESAGLDELEGRVVAC